jgi:VIT1/CCC1 family predicted Fe2+/Mn2+ transporter
MASAKNRSTDFPTSPIETRLKKFHGEDWHSPKGRIIRDIVYAVDTGLITMIAFMAGVSVSLPETHQVMLAGVASAIAGMLAIFFGAFISTKAQRDFFENQIERERQEIIDWPDKEYDEIIEILGEMGFTDEEARVGADRISSNNDTWLKFMVQEEIGLIPGSMDNPIEIALISAGSYLIGVIPPFLPFVFGIPIRTALLYSGGLVVVFLFMFGIAKTRLTKLHWLTSAVETVAFGVLSGGIGLALGHAAWRLLSR